MFPVLSAVTVTFCLLFSSIFFWGASPYIKVDLVPGLELNQLPSKSALTKRTRWEFLLYCALLIYKTIDLLTFVHVYDCRISIESSCC